MLSPANDAWSDVYLYPEAPPSPLPPERLALHNAVEEARAQAAALRKTLDDAEAVLERCREVLDSLRAILEFPSAYRWPEGKLT